MTKCVFCGYESPSVYGIHLIQNDGVVSYFCSSKCRVNALHLKRDKRRLKWTTSFQEEKARATQAHKIHSENTVAAEKEFKKSSKKSK